MAPKLFVNYRRSDAEGDARSIAQHMEKAFGRSNIFFDTSQMRPGDPFPAVLEEALSNCKVMLCIIGPAWLAAREDDGKRRIDNPSDWVRLEIERALARKVKLIPVVLGSATLPKPSDLPESLRPLLDHIAVFVSGANFRHVVEGLERDLRPVLDPLRKRLAVAGVTVLFAGLLVGAYRYGHLFIGSPSPAAPPPTRCVQVPIHAAEPRCIVPGSGRGVWFKDCTDCPEMVVVPAEPFWMGSPSGETDRVAVREEQVRVKIGKPIAVGRFAVTRGEFEAFVRAKGHEIDGGCHVHTSSGWQRLRENTWRSPGFAQDDRHPVVCANWRDAQAYVRWLKEMTNQNYRLLSETEREFVTRAGKSGPFWWGPDISTNQANYNGAYNYANGPPGEYRKGTMRIDSFISNPWGLYNVHGNVWEWTEDCLNEANSGNPGNGTPRKAGHCNRRIVRGGSWFSKPADLRAAYRFDADIDDRSFNGGFRVAREI